MKILSKNHSSYSRVGIKPEQQKLRRAYNNLDKGKISPDKVAKILDSAVAEIIDETKAKINNIMTAVKAFR